MQSKQHWNAVYASKSTDGVSWFQAHALRSLQLIQCTGVATSASIIDVGGGASTLVDDLLGQRYSAVTVLDLSETALTAAQQRGRVITREALLRYGRRWPFRRFSRLSRASDPFD